MGRELRGDLGVPLPSGGRVTRFFPRKQFETGKLITKIKGRDFFLSWRDRTIVSFSERKDLVKDNSLIIFPSI